MSRYVRLAELLAGSEGAALFRHLLDCDDAFVARRLEGMRQQLDALDDPKASGVDVPELDVDRAYEVWASSNDAIDNALIRSEEPVLQEAVAGFPAGQVLDAACGTGRQAVRLVAAGHTVIGVDRSAAMLAVAKQKVPEADARLACRPSRGLRYTRHDLMCDKGNDAGHYWPGPVVGNRNIGGLRSD